MLEAELLDVVEEHEFEGDIDESEREMLEAVVSFRRLTVEEVMTPRTDIQAIEYTDDLEKVKKLVDDRGHSRIPVYEENLDKIVGILYAKDLLRWIIHRSDSGAQKPFVLREILREAMFVPETKTVRELLTELLARQVHIALVADEYGGTSGLVTIEDIIEEIFGEILDEYEEPEDVHGAVMLDEAARAAEIDARVRIDEANDELEAVELELPESDDYDTVGGFVVSTLGRIPAAGESLRAGAVLVEVLEAEPTRVVRVRVTAAPPPEPVAEAATRGETGK
jgi:CBS domain containing-hemolysin-like protein